MSLMTDGRVRTDRDVCHCAILEPRAPPLRPLLTMEHEMTRHRRANRLHHKRGGSAFATRVVIAALVATLFLVASCGSRAPDRPLSPKALEGRSIANGHGCAACHGDNGQGVTGPPWQGLFMSRVKLEGGTTVIADERYLATSITDPGLEIRRDWSLKMPDNQLKRLEVEAVIAYIKELK